MPPRLFLRYSTLTLEYSANRLKPITGASTATLAYIISAGDNGFGDRLSQNGVNYTLDLNMDLTQVLSDGTNTYLYGLGRIAESIILK
ncbi:MAG: hypothetical protein ABIU06_06345 [Anaerolineales bacterium]